MDGSSGSVPHAPKHFYVDHAAYFITAATFQRQPLLTDSVKACLRDALHGVFSAYQWSVEHWVILDDHYHLMARSHRGQDLSLIMRKVHHRVAREVNVEHPPARRGSRQVWHNYWDYCPRDEREYWVRLCYLLNNPVKHGYVSDLHDWPWSSFHRLVGEGGEEDLRRIFMEHPEYRGLRLAEDR